jgi:hypothetical protein
VKKANTKIIIFVINVLRVVQLVQMLKNVHNVKKDMIFKRKVYV